MNRQRGSSAWWSIPLSVIPKPEFQASPPAWIHIRNIFHSAGDPSGSHIEPFVPELFRSQTKIDQRCDIKDRSFFVSPALYHRRESLLVCCGFAKGHGSQHCAVGGLLIERRIQRHPSYDRTFVRPPSFAIYDVVGTSWSAPGLVHPQVRYRTSTRSRRFAIDVA